jgi:MFS transporter, DHA2 family, multidrug resistance protein
MEQLPSFIEYGFRRAFISLIAVLCTFLSVINTSIVTVAFNDIRGNLGISLDQVIRVMTAYALANFIIIPFSSWLSAHLGRRNYFVIAVLLFSICSFLCGNATGIRELVIFRFLQGLGGGAMLVLSHTIITESWPDKKRPTSQAFFILGILAGRVLAGPFGGYITENFSWQYIFFANIPAGIILCVLILACVRNGSYEKREDWLGTIMLTVGISSLYLVLTRGQHNHWFRSPFIILLSLSGLAGIILFIRRQFMVKGLLLQVNVRIGLLLSFFAAVSWAVSSITMSSSLSWGIEPPAIPLKAMIRVTFVMLVLTAVLIEKFRVLKFVIITGMLLFSIYSYMLYQTVPGMSPVYIFWLFMTCSVTLVLLSVSLSTLVLSKLEGTQPGQGAALYNIVQPLGAALGVALFSLYAYPPYLLILIVGIIYLVCIPFVLYFVKNEN